MVRHLKSTGATGRREMDRNRLLHGIPNALLYAPPGLAGPTLMLAIALARWAVWIGPALLLCLWLAGTREDRAAAVAAGAAGAFGLAIAAALSAAVWAPRPFADGSAINMLGHAPDTGFPSDHATLAFSLAFGLLRRRPPSLPKAWLALCAVALAVGWARVFLGAHHLEDIAGGAAVGLASVVTVATRAGRALLSPLDKLGEAVRSRVVTGVRVGRAG